MKRLFATNRCDGAALILRLVLGVVMFAHGAQKVLGWFGGYGFSGTVNAFTTMMHIPLGLAVAAIAAEFLGGLGLILGLLTRLSALGIAVNMSVAVFLVHFQYGFFMNWFGNQKGEGFEYHILAFGIAVALLIKGGGLASVDGIIAGSACEGCEKGTSQG